MRSPSQDNLSVPYLSPCSFLFILQILAQPRKPILTPQPPPHPPEGLLSLLSQLQALSHPGRALSITVYHL